MGNQSGISGRARPGSSRLVPARPDEGSRGSSGRGPYSVAICPPGRPLQATGTEGEGDSVWDDPIRAALEAVLAREPELSMFGLGVWDQRRLSPEERAVILERQRAELLQSRQVAAAIEWLGRIKPRRTINPKRSSYGLKHIVEGDIGYITNGEFIAAAIIAGFGYKRIGHGPNVAFAMSERSIKAAVALRRMARGGDR